VINPFYALLFLVSGVGSLIIAAIAWSRRPLAGAVSLTVVMLSMVIWAWFSAAYWLTPALDARIFLLKLIFIGVVVSSPAIVVMVLDFTGHADWLTRWFYLTLSIVPIAALFLLWTDAWFGLFFNRINILESENILNGGIGFWLAVINGYLSTTFCFVLLAREYLRHTSFRRKQIGLILIGTSIPLALNIMSLLKFSLIEGFDVTPIAFSISGIFYAYGLFPFGMMDLAPMGRTAVFEKIEDGVLVVNRYGIVIDLNWMAKSFMDKGIDDPIGMPMAEVFATWMNETGLHHLLQTGIYRVEVEGPDFYHYDISVTPLVDYAGGVLGQTFIWRDISKQKKSEIELREANIKLKQQLEEVQLLHDQLRESSIRDSLTGIFNRGYMEETLDREFARAIRENTSLSVVMIDVDKFKKVNDTYGHAAGDMVLRTLGNLLVTNIRTGDIACRYGGDEILVVMPDALFEDAIRRARDLAREFSEIIFNFKDLTFQTTLSIGVASTPNHARTVAELLQDADKALYFAKSDNVVKVHGYNPLEYYPEIK